MLKSQKSPIQKTLRGNFAWITVALFVVACGDDSSNAQPSGDNNVVNNTSMNNTSTNNSTTTLNNSTDDNVVDNNVNNVDPNNSTIPDPDPLIEKPEPIILSEVTRQQLGHFATSLACSNCHSNSPNSAAMKTAAGEDVAPFDLWQSSMMANASRDPLFRAVVSVEMPCGRN